MQWPEPFKKGGAKVIYESDDPIQSVAYSQDCRTLYITQTVKGKRLIYAVNLKDPKKKLMISEHKTQVSFGGLPPGDYALRVFHDENDNGVIDTNWAGIPSEAFGFSNGAMGRFGPPSFDDAKFRIESEAVNMTVRLKQF